MGSLRPRTNRNTLNRELGTYEADLAAGGRLEAKEQGPRHLRRGLHRQLHSGSRFFTPARWRAVVPPARGRGYSGIGAVAAEAATLHHATVEVAAAGRVVVLPSSP
jgi:hypothetical protein